jgi:hypothetical protein
MLGTVRHAIIDPRMVSNGHLSDLLSDDIFRDESIAREIGGSGLSLDRESLNYVSNLGYILQDISDS